MYGDDKFILYIPQLFVEGELIGGADIAMELHQNGQLLDILDTSKS